MMRSAPIATAILLATLLAATSAIANDVERMQCVESGLLPRVSLKENLGATATIMQRMESFGIPGASIAVIDEGKVVWARAYGSSDVVEKTPVTTDTLFQAASISKPIAALGALRLVKAGKLSLDEDVNSKLKSWRVPENEFTNEAKVTLRRLMSHTAGLTVHGFAGYAAGSPLPSILQVLSGVSPANSAPVRVDLRPGSRYRYSGGGYTVMQLLIAEISGESFESFMQSKVLDVLGMKSSTYERELPADMASRRASGHRLGGERIPGMRHTYPESAAAGLWTTPTDLAHYLLYVEAAVAGGTDPLLDQALAQAMITRQNGGPQGLGPDIYGTGEFARFGHDGVNDGFEAAMVAYVARGKGVVIMANANLASMFFDEIKGSVARAYAWPGFPSRSQIEAERISKRLLERAPGRYLVEPGTTGVLTTKDGHLFFTMPQRGRIEVFAKNATELFAPPLGSGTFELVESDGKVLALRASDGRELKRLD